MESEEIKYLASKTDLIIIFYLSHLRETLFLNFKHLKLHSRSCIKYFIEHFEDEYPFFNIEVSDSGVQLSINKEAKVKAENWLNKYINKWSSNDLRHKIRSREATNFLEANKQFNSSIDKTINLKDYIFYGTEYIEPILYYYFLKKIKITEICIEYNNELDDIYVHGYVPDNNYEEEIDVLSDSYLKITIFADIENLIYDNQQDFEINNFKYPIDVKLTNLAESKDNTFEKLFKKLTKDEILILSAGNYIVKNLNEDPAYKKVAKLLEGTIKTNENLLKQKILSIKNKLGINQRGLAATIAYVELQGITIPSFLEK